jgi:hypothetical protein
LVGTTDTLVLFLSAIDFAGACHSGAPAKLLSTLASAQVSHKETFTTSMWVISPPLPEANKVPLTGVIEARGAIPLWC